MSRIVNQVGLVLNSGQVCRPLFGLSRCDAQENSSWTPGGAADQVLVSADVFVIGEFPRRKKEHWPQLAGHQDQIESFTLSEAALKALERMYGKRHLARFMFWSFDGLPEGSIITADNPVNRALQIGTCDVTATAWYFDCGPWPPDGDGRGTAVFLTAFDASRDSPILGDVLTVSSSPDKAGRPARGFAATNEDLFVTAASVAGYPPPSFVLTPARWLLLGDVSAIQISGTRLKVPKGANGTIVCIYDLNEIELPEWRAREDWTIRAMPISKSELEQSMSTQMEERVLAIHA